MTASSSVFHDLLQQYWGYSDFRGIQLDIIQSIAAGHDTLGLMPTGGGKSITFQVPALGMEGTCLVITPLIALMKDQVAHLRRRGIQAVAIYSGQSREEMLRLLDNCILGGVKFLYVSPERLSSDLFLTKLRRMRICFITVDEAHCISQWGFDFRPSYLRIADIRKEVPAAPVLALTATATQRVVADIMQQLSFRPADGAPQAFRMSFERKNLRYVVREAEDKPAELLHILRSVGGSAIVYTRSREGTRDVAKLLSEEGIPALYYHAGLTHLDKDVRQKAWQEEDTRVMVATNAFGMGIDKANVRLVVHLDIPDSIEAYFQEAGRAGRDGQTAYAVLLCNKGDRRKLSQRIPETFPERSYIARVYEALGAFFQLAVGDGFNVTYEFNLQKFCRNFRFFPNTVVSALQLLTRAGYLLYRDEDENKSRLIFLLKRDELYRLNHLQARTDRLLQTLLRRYTGLFSDYVYIEEDSLAADCDMSHSEVYETLKMMTHQRILNYIPRKRTPYITFTTRRVDTAALFIPKSVYEERRALFEERIGAVLGYAFERDECRSRYLLRYFDDDSADDCGHCDVCLTHKRSRPDYRTLADRYLTLLADGRPHRPEELTAEGFSAETRRRALDYLLREERICLRDGSFHLA